MSAQNATYDAIPLRIQCLIPHQMFRETVFALNHTFLTSFRRRKAEVAESRARMSVVVMNEFIRDFLKNELVAVAEDAKR